jgi:hypothetical protein
MEKRGTGRRTLLQRGLALIAGGAALVAGARTGRIEAAAPPRHALGTDGTLKLYARKRPLAPPPAGAHGSHRPDGRLLASGELFDTPDGAAVGEFHTNCFCLDTPFGPQAAGSNLEFQVLQLKDGTLFGLCAGSVVNGTAKVHALVGGTGRYAGARGSYFERTANPQSGGHDLVELVVTLAS